MCNQCYINHASYLTFNQDYINEIELQNPFFQQRYQRQLNMVTKMHAKHKSFKEVY